MSAGNDQLSDSITSLLQVVFFMCIVYLIIFVSALCELPGVGAKVADCVCLMSLDKTDAIPVDTHVWQISCRDYNIPELKKTKSLTIKAYKAIGNSILCADWD